MKTSMYNITTLECGTLGAGFFEN